MKKYTVFSILLFTPILIVIIIGIIFGYAAKISDKCENIARMSWGTVKESQYESIKNQCEDKYFILRVIRNI